MKARSLPIFPQRERAGVDRLSDYNVSRCVLSLISSNQAEFAIGTFTDPIFNVKVMFLLSISNFERQLL